MRSKRRGRLMSALEIFDISSQLLSVSFSPALEGSWKQLAEKERGPSSRLLVRGMSVHIGAHCLEPIFYMCGCVCRGRLTLTRKPYNKKPPLIHPFTFATPLLASFFLFLFSPLPSHPFTPPFEHANVCNTRLFLVLVSFGYTHTHIYILALQR